MNYDKERELEEKKINDIKNGKNGDKDGNEKDLDKSVIYYG